MVGQVRHARWDWRSVADRLMVAVIVLAALYQLVWVGRRAADLLVAKVWVNRTQDAVSRSADGAYGYEYMRSTQFLRSEIPVDATVVILPTSDLPQYGDKAFLQYFLIPRNVAYCGELVPEACIESMAGPNVYFMYSGDFQLTGEASLEVHRVPFDEDSGVIAPGARAESQ